MSDADTATAEDGVLHFPDGIPGFPDARAFLLGDLTEDGVFQLLQAAQDPDLSMVVSQPWLFFPDYAPELPEEDRADLGIESPDEAVVFCAVTAGESDQLYVNLLGPFVVNPHTRTGRQVVLADQDWPLRAPVPRDEG